MWTPLDCAAFRGWTKCAEALLDGDSPIDPMDRGKVSLNRTNMIMFSLITTLIAGSVTFVTFVTKL